MSLVKKDITLKIFNKAQLSRELSKSILESFIKIIKKESVKNSVKISNFGTFSPKLTKERIGRNPMTKEEFIIPKIKKLNFKASSTVKETLN